MKLHLPSLLCSALLASMAATATADTYTAEGVIVTGTECNYSTNYATYAILDGSTNRFYDSGKGTYWSNSNVLAGAKELFSASGNSFSFLGDLESRVPSAYSSSCTANSFQNLTDDGGLCWAYTSSNVLQYWQSYYGVFANKAGETSKSTPVHGYNYDTANLKTLGSTQSLKLNMTFYDNWVNGGGNSQTALAWYLGGQVLAESQMETGYAPAGYFADYFTYTGKNDSTGNDYSACRYATTSLSQFSQDVKSLMGNDDGTKGQILHLDLTSTSASGHAITCYGYETDADGNITAVYVTNSDDQSHALLKLTVKWKQMTQGSYTVTGAVLYDGSSKWSYAGKNWRITSMNAISTPEVLKNMLAEYESGKLTWMGNLESWTNSAAVEADVNVLPTDETGWMTYAGTGTEHAGYYNSYYTTGRGVEFNDEATSGSVNVAEDIAVSSMTVANDKLDYTFSGGDSTKTITISGDFTKTGAGALDFSGVKLVANSANLEGDTTFDQLELSGNLNTKGNTVTIKGDSSINNLDSTHGENTLGTTSLVITGGTTQITEGAWVNINDLALSENSRLEVTEGSVSVAGNISTTEETTGALAEGKEAGLKAQWCIKVGTWENGALKDGTGNVALQGSMESGAYILIGNDASISGNLIQTGSKANDGHRVEIGGDASIGGELSAKQNVTIGGDASIGGKVNAATDLSISGNATLGGETTVGDKLTVKGDLTGSSQDTNTQVNATSMELGGNVSKVNLKAQTINVGAADGSTITLDSVNVELTGTDETGAKATLSNAIVTGDSTFSTTAEGILTLNAQNVTFVFDDSNSTVSTTQPLALLSEGDPLTQTTVGGIYYIDSDMLTGVNVSGSLTFDLSHWALDIAQSGCESVVLQFAEDMGFAEGSSVSASLDGLNYVDATYTGDNLAQFSTKELIDAIPEPTTASLSLLALAALAARRRRR